MENENNGNEVFENAQDNGKKQPEEIATSKTCAVATGQNLKTDSMVESKANADITNGVGQNDKTTENSQNNDDSTQNIPSKHIIVIKSELANSNEEKGSMNDRKQGVLKVCNDTIEQNIVQSKDNSTKNSSDENGHEENNIYKLDFENLDNLDFEILSAETDLTKLNSEDKIDTAKNSHVKACEKSETLKDHNKLKPIESVKIGPSNNCVSATEVNKTKDESEETASTKALENTAVNDNANSKVLEEVLSNIKKDLNSRLTPELCAKLKPYQKRIFNETHVIDVLTFLNVYNVQFEKYVMENILKIRNPLLRFWPTEKATSNDGESECKVLHLILKLPFCNYQHIKLILDLATNFDTNARLMRLRILFRKNKIFEVLIRFQSHLECEHVHDKLKQLNIPNLLRVAYDKGYTLSNKISPTWVTYPSYEEPNDPLSAKTVELNAEYMKWAPTLLDKMKNKIAYIKDQTSYSDFLTSCSNLRMATLANKIIKEASPQVNQAQFNKGDERKSLELDADNCRVVHVSGVCTSLEGNPDINHEDIHKTLQDTFKENYEVIQVGKRDLVILCPSHENAIEVVKLLDNVAFPDHSISAKLDIDLCASRCIVNDKSSNVDDISKMLKYDDPNINVFTMRPVSDKKCENISPSELNKYGLNGLFLFERNLNKIPLSCKIVVTNLHPEIKRKNVHEIFSLAGTIRSLHMSHNRSYENICQEQHYIIAHITYDHPLEALQAVSMFNLQNIFNCIVKVEIDTNLEKKTFPFGLVTVGPGLGPNGEPLQNLRAYTEIRKIQSVLHLLGAYNQTALPPECPYRHDYEPKPPNSINNPANLAELNNFIQQKFETVDLTKKPATGKNCGNIINSTAPFSNVKKIQPEKTVITPPPMKKVKPTPAATKTLPNKLSKKKKKILRTTQKPIIAPAAKQNAEQISTISAAIAAKEIKLTLNIVENSSATHVPKLPSLLDLPFNNTKNPSLLHPYTKPVNTDWNNPLPGPTVPNFPPASQYSQGISDPGSYAYPSHIIIPVNQPADPRNRFPDHGNHLPSNIPCNVPPDVPPYGFGNEPPGQIIRYHPGEPGNLHGNPVAGSFPQNINQLNQLPQVLVDPRVHRNDPRSHAHRTSPTVDDVLKENRKRRIDEEPSDLLAFSNLPSSVTTLALTTKMLEIGDVEFGKVSSSGQGLVRFKNLEDAIKCVKLFKHSKVDGQIIEVEYA